MTTALDLITDALLEIGVLAVGESVQPEDSALALRRLNQMLASWSTQPMGTFTNLSETYTLVPGQSTYTVGPGGNFVGSRPIAVTSARVNYQGVDFGLNPRTQEQFDAIPLKTQRAIVPEDFLYNNSMPTGTLQLWPTPSAAVSITLVSDQKLQTNFALTTALVAPEGYERAIRLALAIELCPTYGRQASAELVNGARAAIAHIKRMNRRTPISRVDPAICADPPMFNYITGR